MNCETFDSLLDDYLDASLEPSDRRAVEAHLSTCEACRRETERLRSLLGQAAQLRRMPARDLWPLISAEIDRARLKSGSDGPIVAPGRPWASRIRRIAWPIAAAIALGILGLLAAVRLARRTTVPAHPKTGAYDLGRPGSASAAVAGIPPQAVEHSGESASSSSKQTLSGVSPEVPRGEIDNQDFSTAGAQIGDQRFAQPASSAVTPSPPDLSGYVLDIRRPGSSIPLYLPIGGSVNASIGERMLREDERLPAPGDWLRLRTSPQGGAVLLHLSILKGDLGLTVIDEQGRVTAMPSTAGSQSAAEEVIGSYWIRPGEVVRLLDLRRFNTKPMEVRVVRDRPDTPTPLRVINKTSCMAVVGIEEKAGRRYELTLKNSGKRPVVGFVHRHRNAVGYRNWPIAPGETIVLRAAFLPTDPNPPEVTLSMALLDDGSYEGDVDSLALFYSQTRLAPRQHAKRMLPLLTEALESWPTKDAEEIAETLRSQIASLPSTCDSETLEEVMRMYPSLPRTPSFVLTLKAEGEMRKWASVELIEMRRKKEINGKIDPELLKSWLVGRKKDYEELLSVP